MFFNELFAGLMFDGVEWIGLGLLGYKQVLEFDGVIVWLKGQ